MQFKGSDIVSNFWLAFWTEEYVRDEDKAKANIGNMPCTPNNPDV